MVVVLPLVVLVVVVEIGIQGDDGKPMSEARCLLFRKMGKGTGIGTGKGKSTGQGIIIMGGGMRE